MDSPRREKKRVNRTAPLVKKNVIRERPKNPGPPDHLTGSAHSLQRQLGNSHLQVLEEEKRSTGNPVGKLADEEVEATTGTSYWEVPIGPAKPEILDYVGTDEEKQRIHEQNERRVGDYRDEYETYIDDYISGLEARTTVEKIKDWGPPAPPFVIYTPKGEYTVWSAWRFWRKRESLSLFYGGINVELKRTYTQAWLKLGKQIPLAQGKRAAGTFFLDGGLSVTHKDEEGIEHTIEHKVTLDTTGLKAQPVEKLSYGYPGDWIPIGLQGTVSIAPKGELVEELELKAGAFSVSADSEGNVKFSLKSIGPIQAVSQCNLEKAEMQMGIELDFKPAPLKASLNVGFRGLTPEEALFAITSPGFWAEDTRTWATSKRK